MLLNCGVGEDSWESLGLQGDPTSPSWRRSAPGVLWKDWFWSWNSNTLATWCKELTHWKRLWCWERLRAGGEGDDRGWDSQMASPTQWTWIWVDSGSWWWTGTPGVQGVARSRTQLSDWTELNRILSSLTLYHLFISKVIEEHLCLPGIVPGPGVQLWAKTEEVPPCSHGAHHLLKISLLSLILVKFPQWQQPMLS